MISELLIVYISAMKSTSLNRVLIYTMLAIIVIATYITINSYYTQVAIYEEKEMFKLDCIANAVAYKISGEEHNNLVYTYPRPDLADSAHSDNRYKKIFEQMSMAKIMTKVPSEMYTIVKHPDESKFYKVINTEDKPWLDEIKVNSGKLGELYSKGGMIGRFETPQGTFMGALSPIMNKNMESVGVLQVNESFDSFLGKARDQVYFNILLSLVFIAIIGTLMFFSVKNILKKQQRLEIERANVEQLKTELFANISHDLRTPLSSIHGYLETLLLKKESLDEEQRERYLNTSLQSTKKLKYMVDELFDLSKIESKERKLSLANFDLAELVFDTINSFKVAAQEKGVELINHVKPGLTKVNADIELIDRVLHNLISNAIKYCHKNDKVEISTTETASGLMITVRDSGSGISAEDLPHVFNRFHKGKTSKQGTGLGLAIVKGVLELHHSTYNVSSELGKGTTFNFSLKKAE